MSAEDFTQLHQRSGQGLVMLDVRTPVEFSQVHLRGAQSMPLDKLHADAVKRQQSGADPIYLLCQTGPRAVQAQRKLSDAGLDNCVVVEGGTSACIQSGADVIRSSTKVISLERQVRIAAGGLVFLGTILAVLLSPWFFILPGFVGAGLMFAGITNTCGMAMLLAKMPWNQVAH